MKKQEFVAKQAEVLGITNKQVNSIVEEYIKYIVNELKEGNPVRLNGLGTLKTATRASYKYSNPVAGTGVVPSKTVVRFVESSKLFS